jgi:D-amino-acid oxidase
MESGISRRRMVQTSLMMAAGAVLGTGCAGLPASPRGAPLRTRGFAPVRAEDDRLIRAVAGLRPFRAPGFVVRAERMDDRALIHNYGHGGGGISLSWGSSELAAELAAETGEREFAVLGAGVMGLTTARRLQDRGFAVTLYTRDLPPDTTSNIAGGHWTPTSVFRAADASPAFLAQFERASRFAHRFFQNLAGERYGVRWIENYVLRDEPPGPPPANPISDLYPDVEVLGPGEHPFPSAYAHRRVTMLVEPAVFLDTLTRDFLLRGGRIVIREFRDRAELRELPERALVNCCGLGSRALFGDEQLVPVKGQLAVLLPQPEVDYILIAGEYYMFPRSDGIILGGTFEQGEWSPEVEPEVIARIVAGHRAVFERMG